MKAEDSHFNKQKGFTTWQLFLLKSLLIQPDEGVETNLGLLTYKEKAIFFHQTKVLEMLLDLADSFGLEVKAQITEGAMVYDDPNKELEIRDEMENSNESLYRKAFKELNVKDLRKILFSDLKYRDRILDEHLTLYLGFHGSKKEIAKILDHHISLFMKGQIEKYGQFFSHTFYTYEYQKSNFLKNIPSYTSRFGKEMDLKEKEDFAILGDDPTKISFLETFLGLEKEGYIDIYDINSVNLDLTHPHKTEQELTVSFRVHDNLISQAVSPLEPAGSVTVPPRGWELTPRGRELHIMKDGQSIFSFKRYSSKRCRYFRCLWKHYGQKKTYKEVFEYESSEKYPGEKKAYQTNDDVRNAMRKLQKDFQTKPLPIFINTDLGLTLTIKD